jgi:hypothetical protein
VARVSAARWRPTPTEAALLLCVHAEQDAARRARLTRVLRAGRVTPANLLAEAARHEVLPLATEALVTGRHLDSASPSVAQAAEAERRQVFVRNLANHAELRRVGEALAAHGVPAVALKGTHLALRLFDAIDGRQTRDIDVLVPPREVARARDVLRDLGYRPHDVAGVPLDAHPFHGAPWVRRALPLDTVVELHWGLEDPRVARVDYGLLWRRILAHRREQDGLLALPSEECLLFLALHAVKSTRGLLRLLADIDRLLRREGPSLDWGYTVALAGDWDAPWMLHAALCWTRLFYGTPLPSRALDELEPPARRRILLELLVPPRVIVRPPASDRLRMARLRSAHFAMMRPTGRARRAYLAYLRGERSRRVRRHGRTGALTVTARQAASGLCWSVLAVAAAAWDAVRPGHRHGR